MKKVESDWQFLQSSLSSIYSIKPNLKLQLWLPRYLLFAGRVMRSGGEHREWPGPCRLEEATIENSQQFDREPNRIGSVHQHFFGHFIFGLFERLLLCLSERCLGQFPVSNSSERLDSMGGYDKLHHRSGDSHSGKILQDRLSIWIQKTLFRLDDSNWNWHCLPKWDIVGNCRHLDKPSQGWKVLQIPNMVQCHRIHGLLHCGDRDPVPLPTGCVLLRIWKHLNGDQTSSWRSPIARPGRKWREKWWRHESANPDDHHQDVDHSHGGIRHLLLAQSNLLHDDALQGSNQVLLLCVF